MKEQKECLECGRVYHRKIQAWIRWVQSSFCSSACHYDNQRGRLWNEARSSSNAKGCWLWPNTTPLGYARIGKVPKFAHRIAWERANARVVPDGLFVLHRCDVPNCVNPDHLFIGTQADNMRDMAAKGRSMKGRKNPLSNRWRIVARARLAGAI